jgi:SAM-dependent methyltransferase
MSEGTSYDYDRIWDEVYGDMQDLGPTHRHMVRLMGGLLRRLEYGDVVDVGVGFGHNLPVLTRGRQLQRIAGVDISARAVEHVRSRWSGDFHELDITRERLPGRFDLVCCALLLEHLQDDVGALRNMRMMTARHLLVVTIGGEWARYRPWEQQVGHVRNYGPGELEAKLQASGFTLQRMIRWGFPLYSPVVRTLQNRMTLSSELSLPSRSLAHLLYAAFFLNSSRRGDLLIALAAPR